MIDNNPKQLDIYLMGIGGTGMGAFGGLLQSQGASVRGSDSQVFSPMKEKLADWGISYQTPYSAENLAKKPDLVIIGNVIRRENPEAQLVLKSEIPYESFPSALSKMFLKDSVPLVATGTHGKTTCSSLMAHTLYHAGFDPGFLIGGIPKNFQESFRLSSEQGKAFVVEGDEYDTAFFDKRPKFIHYRPQFLLLTSLEFDHGDIYADVDAIITEFTGLMNIMDERGVLVINTPVIPKAHAARINVPTFPGS